MNEVEGSTILSEGLLLHVKVTHCCSNHSVPYQMRFISIALGRGNLGDAVSALYQ